MMSETQSLIQKHAILTNSLRATSDEAKRLQTIVGNFDREAESAKDKPEVVKALQDKSQPFRNRLGSLQPSIDKTRQQLADVELQLKAMQGVKE